MTNGVELPALPGATVLMLVGWNVVGLAILVGAIGPWVLVPWAVALVVAGMQVAHGRRRLAQPFAARATPTDAVAVPPPPTGPAAAAGAPSRRAWSGAALVPTALGGMNATMPLAELSIDDDGVVVRVRPSVVALMFGYRPTPLAPSDTEAVIPVRRTTGTGVAIRPKGRPATYFFNADVAHILGELHRAGFPVDWREQRVRLWGRAR